LTSSAKAAKAMATPHLKPMFERLTQRLVTEARSPRAEAVLAFVAFVESSVFPLPAEVIFLPMCLARPERALRYAAIAAVASVLGGIFGWMIGHYLFDLVAAPILNFWHSMPAFERLKAATGTGTILILLITSGAAHLPPMKVVTILAGAIGFNLPLFILAAIVARGTKFFLLGWALAKYGAAIADVIARRLALVAIVVIVAALALWLAKSYL
jgi:membrane protein YqaA with SNARE-associated domain